jgi:16S rRNA (cytosine1402-N4)-methyltransferase
MAPGQDDLSQFHDPVMVEEVLEHLLPDDAADPSVGSGLFVDGTVGAGGHAAALLERAPSAQLIGLDRDEFAVTLARKRLAPHGARARVFQRSYADLAEVLAEAGAPAPIGILLDLGLSSMQVDDPERGFSFRFPDAAPDMRFDATSEADSAAEWLNRASEHDIFIALSVYGGEPRARAVARALVAARPIMTVGQLANVIRGHAVHLKRIDAATRSFQGIRIAVNDEFGHLERGLRAAIEALAPRGRLVVLCFHSGEERLVKEAFRVAKREGKGHILTKKPIRAMESEVRRNPRARPTRLRAFQRGEE